MSDLRDLIYYEQEAKAEKREEHLEELLTTILDDVDETTVFEIIVDEYLYTEANTKDLVNKLKEEYNLKIERK